MLPNLPSHMALSILVTVNWPLTRSGTIGEDLENVGSTVAIMRIIDLVP